MRRPTACGIASEAAAMEGLTSARWMMGSGGDWRRRGGRAADDGCGVREGDGALRGRPDRRLGAAGARWRMWWFGLVVEAALRRRFGEREWMPGCYVVRRSRRHKRRGTATASSAASAGRSLPKSGSAVARRCEGGWRRGRERRVGETDEGRPGSIFMGSGW